MNPVPNTLEREVDSVDLHAGVFPVPTTRQSRLAFQCKYKAKSDQRYRVESRYVCHERCKRSTTRLDKCLFQISSQRSKQMQCWHREKYLSFPTEPSPLRSPPNPLPSAQPILTAHIR